MLTIKVLYSCWTCGLKKAGCDVPARDNEKIEQWMNQMMRHLADDHDRRSPGCVPADGMLHDVMIPVAPDTKVGGLQGN